MIINSRCQLQKSKQAIQKKN